MKYNDFYFWMFKSPMKKVLAEKYGREYAADIMKKSKKVYRELVGKAADIGDDNPMAYNELFALAFVAPYIASGKKIPPETVQEMMRRSLYHIKWYFAKTDLNTDKGKAENKKSIVKYVKWYTPEKEKQYPTSFKVSSENIPVRRFRMVGKFVISTGTSWSSRALAIHPAKKDLPVPTSPNSKSPILLLYASFQFST